MIIYQKLKDQQEQEELIERYGIFYGCFRSRERTIA